MYQIIFFIISINPYSILFKNKNKILDNRHLYKLKDFLFQKFQL